MNLEIPKIYFDRQDHDLLRIVDDILNRDKTRKDLKMLLNPHLHPHGIKEMAAFKELRIAYAASHLLDILEWGDPQDRLSALRSLRDDVLYGAQSDLIINTARVLLQVMKELLRSHGDYRERLELARDFRSASYGKPRVVRALLKRYHLLEMPEEWNQMSFDGHVHDSSTKGRKSPTHLITDAWIKGIRFLTVIYYHYVRPEVASELLEAAEIMGIHVRIGIEFPAKFRNKYIKLIWAPRGFSDAMGFLDFLSEEPVGRLMEEGRKISDYHEATVLAVLQHFNEKNRHSINEAYGLGLNPLVPAEFLAYVGRGQASTLHLAEFVHSKMLPALQERVKELRQELQSAKKPEIRSQITSLLQSMNDLGPKKIVDRYLRPIDDPEMADDSLPTADVPEQPGMLKLSPHELIDRLAKLRSGARITLNMSDVTPEDALEVLYDCQGAITHIEIFNLKDYATGRAKNNQEINEIRQIINEGNAIRMKRMIHGLIRKIEKSWDSDSETRVEKFKTILRDMEKLRSYYRSAPLKAHLGSDSTGRLNYMYGMGLVIKETLKRRAQKEIEKSKESVYNIIPINIAAYLQVTYTPRPVSTPLDKAFAKLVRRFPGLRLLSRQRKENWDVRFDVTGIEPKGNIATLGGRRAWCGNNLCPEEGDNNERSPNLSLKYLNTGYKNALKVLTGFIPAFVSFYLTKDWFLLKYFGAVIWLGITALRNVIQSVLGGGGLRSSPLLRWNDYVSWERVADSLLYTGFSVPLLDFLVKGVILDKGLHITTATNPVALYSIMAVVNGTYLCTHNILRGLQKQAAYANIFRSVFSIPIAIALNALLGGVLGAAGVTGIQDILQKWAAVISKFASDCVAGFIEGTADRNKNVRMLIRDYKDKFSQLFDTYSRLEMLFPEKEIVDMLDSPRNLIKTIETESSDLEKVLIINALDMLYFWMYQPRARTALAILYKDISPDERNILIGSQSILERNKEISQLFVDGLVGKNFSRALSFYLDRSSAYLKDMRELAESNGNGSEEKGVLKTKNA